MKVLAAGAVSAGSAEIGGACHDRQGRLEIRHLGRVRADEHVAREEAVPGAVGDHPHRQPVVRVGAGVEVLDEQLAALQIGQHSLLQVFEARRLDRLVDGAPPDRVLRPRLVDDVFVPGRAASVPPGVHDKAAAKPELTLASPHRMLIDRARSGSTHRPEVMHPLRQGRSGVCALPTVYPPGPSLPPSSPGKPCTGHAVAAA